MAEIILRQCSTTYSSVSMGNYRACHSYGISVAELARLPWIKLSTPYLSILPLSETNPGSYDLTYTCTQITGPYRDCDRTWYGKKECGNWYYRYPSSTETLGLKIEYNKAPIVNNTNITLDNCSTKVAYFSASDPQDEGIMYNNLQNSYNWISNFDTSTGGIHLSPNSHVSPGLYIIESFASNGCKTTAGAKINITIEMCPFQGGIAWGSFDKYPRIINYIKSEKKIEIVGFGTSDTYFLNHNGVGCFKSATSQVLNFTYNTGSWTSYDIYPRLIGDVNGDGKSDIVGFKDGELHIAYGSSTGFSPIQKQSIGFTNSDGWTSYDKYPRLLGDVNLDGRVEIVGFKDGELHIAYGSSTGFDILQKQTIPLTNSDGWISYAVYPRLIGDVNGDGKSDIVGFKDGKIYIVYGDFLGFRSNVEEQEIGEFTNAEGWISFNKFPRYLADIDGDGNADIVGIKGSKIYVSFYRDGNFSKDIKVIDTDFKDIIDFWGTYDENPISFVDVNKDGKDDIISYTRATTPEAYDKIFTYYGTGESFYLVDNSISTQCTIKGKNSKFIGVGCPEEIVAEDTDRHMSSYWDIKIQDGYNYQGYSLLQNSISKKYLGITGDSQKSLTLYDRVDASNVNYLLWQVEKLVTGYFFIKNKDSGLYLELNSDNDSYAVQANSKIALDNAAFLINGSCDFIKNKDFLKIDNLEKIKNKNLEECPTKIVLNKIQLANTQLTHPGPFDITYSIDCDGYSESTKETLNAGDIKNYSSTLSPCSSGNSYAKLTLKETNSSGNQKSYAISLPPVQYKNMQHNRVNEYPIGQQDIDGGQLTLIDTRIKGDASCSAATSFIASAISELGVDAACQALISGGGDFDVLGVDLGGAQSVARATCSAYLNGKFTFDANSNFQANCEAHFGTTGQVIVQKICAEGSASASFSLEAEANFWSITSGADVKSFAKANSQGCANINDSPKYFVNFGLIYDSSPNCYTKDDLFFASGQAVGIRNIESIADQSITSIIISTFFDTTKGRNDHLFTRRYDIDESVKYFGERFATCDYSEIPCLDKLRVLVLSKDSPTGKYQDFDCKADFQEGENLKNVSDDYSVVLNSFAHIEYEKLIDKDYQYSCSVKPGFQMKCSNDKFGNWFDKFIKLFIFWEAPICSKNIAFDDVYIKTNTASIRFKYMPEKGSIIDKSILVWPFDYASETNIWNGEKSLYSDDLTRYEADTIFHGETFAQPGKCIDKFIYEDDQGREIDVCVDVAHAAAEMLCMVSAVTALGISMAEIY